MEDTEEWKGSLSQNELHLFNEQTLLFMSLWEVCTAKLFQLNAKQEIQDRDLRLLFTVDLI